MRFSIIMPTMGKRREFIRRAVDSVLSQDFADFELIIKNGGDDVSDLLPDDPRIRHVMLKDSGIGQGMNQGCELARGEILSEANDDDFLSPGSLAAVDAAIGDAMWLYGQMSVLGSVYGGAWDFSKLLRGNYIPQPTVYFRKEAWREAGGFDEENGLAADYDMWLKLGSKHVPVYLPKVLADYGVHPGQLTNTAFAEQSAQAANVRRKYESIDHRA